MRVKHVIIRANLVCTFPRLSPVNVQTSFVEGSYSDGHLDLAGSHDENVKKTTSKTGSWFTFHIFDSSVFAPKLSTDESRSFTGKFKSRRSRFQGSLTNLESLSHQSSKTDEKLVFCVFKAFTLLFFCSSIQSNPLFSLPGPELSCASTSTDLRRSGKDNRAELLSLLLLTVKLRLAGNSRATLPRCWADWIRCCPSSSFSLSSCLSSSLLPLPVVGALARAATAVVVTALAKCHARMQPWLFSLWPLDDVHIELKETSYMNEALSNDKHWLSTDRGMRAQQSVGVVSIDKRFWVTFSFSNQLLNVPQNEQIWCTLHYLIHTTKSHSFIDIRKVMDVEVCSLGSQTSMSINTWKIRETLIHFDIAYLFAATLSRLTPGKIEMLFDSVEVSGPKLWRHGLHPAGVVKANNTLCW